MEMRPTQLIYSDINSIMKGYLLTDLTLFVIGELEYKLQNYPPLISIDPNQFRLNYTLTKLLPNIFQ